MESSRRDFLVASSAAAASVALTFRPDVASAADGGALRLLTYADAAGAPKPGVLKPDGRIAPVAAASMLALIGSGATGLAAARAALAKPGGPKPGDVRLFSPIPRPERNIYAVGWNYLEHFQEGVGARTDAAPQKYPDHPVFFTKGQHTMNGPYDAIPYDPAVSTMIDWEGELAVIIGKRGRNIAEADAMSYVFGYSVINDTTARDVQQSKHGGQWFKGKSIDGHGPMGPWIVTADGLDPSDLHLQTRINGVTKQDASTKQMFFKIPRIIAELSLGLTLEPGDVIATGTPPGVGYARKPPEFLKPGDVMETEIAGIGIIRNTIRAV